MSFGLTFTCFNRQLPIYCCQQKSRYHSIPDSAPRLSTSEIPALSFKIAVHSRSITVRDQIQATRSSLQRFKSIKIQLNSFPNLIAGLTPITRLDYHSLPFRVGYSIKKRCNEPNHSSFVNLANDRAKLPEVASTTSRDRLFVFSIATVDCPVQRHQTTLSNLLKYCYLTASNV